MNARAPYAGYCYGPSGGIVVNCHENTVSLGPQYSVPSLNGASCAVPGKPADGTACTYMMAENGLAGTYSGTTPNFYGASITDQYRPTDKWLFNAGVRLDSFGFVGQNTTSRRSEARPRRGRSGSRPTTSTIASTIRRAFPFRRAVCCPEAR